MSFVCTACLVDVDDPTMQREHYKTDWHRYNLKRKVAGFKPVSEIEFCARKEATLAAEASKSGQGFKARCLNCRKTFISKQALDQHTQSKKHIQTVRKSRDEEKIEINGIVTSTTEQRKPAEDLEKSLADLNVKTAPADPHAHGSCGTHCEAHEHAAGNDECTEFLDDTASLEKHEDEELHTLEPMHTSTGEGEVEAQTVDILECIFCSLRSDSLESSLQHMQKEHGFFIHDVEYLADLEGLIEYLCAKVRIGKVCLYCNGKGKAFKTHRDCQKHMQARAHCKLRYEAEEDLDEYAAFYDFAQKDSSDADDVTDSEDEDNWETESEGESDDEEEVYKESKRGVDNLGEAEVTDLGELMLPDGRCIGARQYRHLYKQKPKMEDDRESIAIGLKEKLLLSYNQSGISTVSVFSAEMQVKAKQYKMIQRSKKYLGRRKAQANLDVRSHKLDLMSFR